MAKLNLTDRKIKSLNTSLSREDFWDTGFRGGSFGVRVSANGVKQFTLLYRNKSGKQKRLKIGDATTMRLADARASARSIITRVDLGDDPAVEVSSYKRAERFSEVCELYLELHAKVNKKASSANEDERIIRRELVPAWGNFKACDIRRRDVIALLDRIRVGRAAPVQANRTRALISKIFNFALERELVTVSPCAGLPRVRRERPKERCLTHDEIKRLLEALTSESPHVAGVLKLILFTAQRPGEVKNMRWSDIIGDKWRIPASATKNGRPHLVHLPSQVASVLDDLRAHNARLKSRSRKLETEKDNYDVYVFPSRTGGNLKWLQKLCARVQCKVGGETFSSHDLRRTAATNLAKLGTSRDVLSKILNHASADNTVTGVYDRYDRGEERALALQRWADRLDEIEGGACEQVVVRAAFEKRAA